jgi:hypothetical protein
LKGAHHDHSGIHWGTSVFWGANAKLRGYPNPVKKVHPYLSKKNKKIKCFFFINYGQLKLQYDNYTKLQTQLYETDEKGLYQMSSCLPSCQRSGPVDTLLC